MRWLVIWCLVFFAGCTASETQTFVANRESFVPATGLILPSELPTTGTSRFEGGVVLNTLNMDIVGTTEFLADFAENRIRASDTKLQNAESEFVGVATFEDAEICRCADLKTQYTFDGRFSGQFEAPSGGILIDGVWAGDFYQADVQVMKGDIIGLSTLGAQADQFSGEFWAKTVD